ncbi:MAG: hypothetical protein ABWX58_12330 [Psychrobacillus psychrotolerans]
MSNKSKPNFKKKEPNSRSDNREEFSGDLSSNEAKSKNEKQNNQKNR